MAARRDKRGSGLTAREIDTRPEAVSLAIGTAKSGPVAPLERWALDTLAAVEIESPRTALSSGWRAVVDERGFAEDSAEGYAGRILENIRYIRAGKRNGDFDQVELFAFELGAVAKEAAVKFFFEAAWLTGSKVLTGSALGGRLKRGTTAERDAEMAEKFRERRKTSHMSDTALKEAVGGEYQLGRSAAIAAIDRGLKKSSG